MYLRLISSRRNERESQDSLRRDEKNIHGRNRIDRGILIFCSNPNVSINLLSPKDWFRILKLCDFLVISIDYDNRRTGGDRNFDKRDGPRDRQTEDKRDTDRRGITRDNRNDKKPGNDENRRDTTPPPMKKFEEAKVPVSIRYIYTTTNNRYINNNIYDCFRSYLFWF